MIDDTAVESAVDWLLKNAPEAGRLRGERVYCEEYRKSLKAILASQANENAEAAKERWAYAHSEYQIHLERLRDAVTADEVNRAQRATAELRIEVWRTQSSNNRAVKL
jgi:hypothetical protein